MMRLFTVPSYRLTVGSPTALQRSEVLCDKENLLRKCDESAYSIIPSKMSISIDDSERRRSIESTEMSYQQLSIDDDLFTAEVYKRNYRSTLIRQLLQEKRQVRAESPQSSYKISVANSDQSDYDLDSIHRRESSVYEECLENQKIARSEPQDNEPPSPTEIGSPSVPSKECQSLEPGLEKTMAEGQIYRHAHEKAKISWCDYQRSKSFESLAKSGETTQATFLLLSACYGEFDNISEVDLLLQKGANSNSRMSWGTGQTALHIAIRYQQPDVAEILIRYGADVNACDQVGSTPLHEAVRNKDPDMAFRLLQAGARVGCKNNSGQQAIHFAASSAYLVDLLLDNGASADCLDDNMYQPLHYLSHAMRGNCCEAALIKKGGNVESRSRWGYTPLQMACLFNRFTILRVLLSWGASLNVGDDFVATPLALATYNRNPSMVDFLLLSGVDANLSCDVTGRTVSHLIAQNNVGPNACDAAHGSTIIHLLARHGADFNVRDFQGNTVLHHMASRFSAASTTTEARRAIDAFIIHGADFNARNLKGQSPMFLAAKHLNVHLIRHFRRKGAASLTDDEFELLRRYWKEKSAFASQHMRERAEKLLVSFEDIENGYL